MVRLSFLLTTAAVCLLGHAAGAQVPAASGGDLVSVDSLLRRIFQNQDYGRYARAAGQYVDLIAQAGEPRSDADRAVVARHLAALAVLLAPAEHARVFDAGGAPLPDAGAFLRVWWRRQDPLPATAWNERVVEHLERAYEAERRFACARCAAGFDARGEVYVRLGEPSRIDRFENDFLASGSPTRYPELKEAFMNDPDIQYLTSTLFIPPNEFWRYQQLGTFAHFLFVQGKHGYELAETHELLPTTLRGGYFTSERGRAKTLAALVTFSEYLQQLAALNPEYVTQYINIDEYIRRLEGGSTREPPYLFIQRQLTDARRNDHRIEERRRKDVPRVYSDVERGALLPVEARWARFLRENGSTRTEVYWSFPPDALVPSLGTQFALKDTDPTDPFELHVTAVQKMPDFRTHVRTRGRVRVDGWRLQEPDSAPVFTTVFESDTALFHLALQWDQYVTVRPEGAPPHLAFVRTGLFRADSLRPLNATPGILEMSDPVPLRAGEIDDTTPVRTSDGFRATPVPFRAIDPTTALALYFEVYHLAYGPDDRTRFTVEYEVYRRRPRGGLRGLWGDEERVTSASTSFQRDTRTAREYILLDMSEMHPADALVITVRVTDEITGQQVERSLRFEPAS